MERRVANGEARESRKAPTGKEAAGLLSRLSLFGGTAWCFANPGFTRRLDSLFVDEASQVSLANVVAMSRAAKNLVLVGDQMQLSQPTRGSHPGESGLSSLDYALAGQVTIPNDRGIFLETTYRLHPSICEFVSGAFYEDRLHSDPRNERRRLDGIEPGLRFVPVPHEGNTQGSDEEVEAVRGLVDDLLDRPFVDRDGERAGTIGFEQILIVTPYNLQVRKLIAALPVGGGDAVGESRLSDAPGCNDGRMTSCDRSRWEPCARCRAGHGANRAYARYVGHEFQSDIYVETVARECDRFEHELTGADRE